MNFGYCFIFYWYFNLKTSRKWKVIEPRGRTNHSKLLCYLPCVYYCYNHEKDCFVLLPLLPIPLLHYLNHRYCFEFGWGEVFKSTTRALHLHPYSNCNYCNNLCCWIDCGVVYHYWSVSVCCLRESGNVCSGLLLTVHHLSH